MKPKKPSVKSIRKWNRLDKHAKGRVIVQNDKAHDGDTKKPEPKPEMTPEPEVKKDQETAANNAGSAQRWKIETMWIYDDKAQDGIITSLMLAEPADWKWMAALVSMIGQSAVEERPLSLTTHPDMKPALVRLHEAMKAAAKVVKTGGGMALAG